MESKNARNENHSLITFRKKSPNKYLIRPFPQKTTASMSSTDPLSAAQLSPSLPRRSSDDESDDEFPALSAHTLAALNEFLAERDLQQKEASAQASDVAEDWQLSQFWVGFLFFGCMHYYSSEFSRKQKIFFGEVEIQI